MNDFWLKYLAAFLIVIAALIIGVAVQEYIEWRKHKRTP
jgi:hypothetical protein